ncbi:phage tail protein I [Phaeobacter sp. 11ANDIMAR09]|uniref:phage tail protein I n=1 Tax=Phaeobacter sp. 11ANDIMAR09 TaxID=1225647 RepID=UPI0006C8DC2A|nr:phage tail protein I [Phaeobacter sp. 11ANDIMAR09]
MYDVKNTQLPPTATPLAKALDILEERLFSLPVQMISKDPATVGVGLLDHLAWEHSVDVWDLDWPEDVKRSVVAVSAEVHRFKGTPHAIRTALAAFDVDTELLEWFEPEGVADAMDAGSFRVTAYASRSLYGPNENTIDNRMVHAMNSVVQRVAPVSRKLVFRLGERFRTEGYLRTGARPAHLHQADIDPGPRPAQAEGGPMLRTGQRIRRVCSETHEPQPRPAPAPVAAYVRLAARALAVSQEFHDVQRRAAG